MRKVLAILALAVLFAGCTKKGDGFSKAELESDDVRFIIGSEETMDIDPAFIQTGFNREKREFRINSDTMSDYVVAILSEIPSVEGQKISADLEWTTEMDVKTKKGISFKVEEIEDGVCWLWNKSGKITLVVKILD